LCAHIVSLYKTLMEDSTALKTAPPTASYIKSTLNVNRDDINITPKSEAIEISGKNINKQCSLLLSEEGFNFLKNTLAKKVEENKKSSQDFFTLAKFRTAIKEAQKRLNFAVFKNLADEIEKFQQIDTNTIKPTVGEDLDVQPAIMSINKIKTLVADAPKMLKVLNGSTTTPSVFKKVEIVTNDFKNKTKKPRKDMLTGEILFTNDESNQLIGIFVIKNIMSDAEYFEAKIIRVNTEKKRWSVQIRQNGTPKTVHVPHSNLCQITTGYNEFVIKEENKLIIELS